MKLQVVLLTSAFQTCDLHGTSQGGRYSGTGDPNSIGAYLEKTYPKDDSQTFSLARPGLYGDSLRDPKPVFQGTTTAESRLSFGRITSDLAKIQQ